MLTQVSQGELQLSVAAAAADSAAGMGSAEKADSQLLKEAVAAQIHPTWVMFPPILSACMALKCLNTSQPGAIRGLCLCLTCHRGLF